VDYYRRRLISPITLTIAWIKTVSTIVLANGYTYHTLSHIAMQTTVWYVAEGLRDALFSVIFCQLLYNCTRNCTWKKLTIRRMTVKVTKGHRKWCLWTRHMSILLSYFLLMVYYDNVSVVQTFSRYCHFYSVRAYTWPWELMYSLGHDR